MNLPIGATSVLASAIMGPDGVAEGYNYDADGERVLRMRYSTITLYFRDLVEEDVGGEQRELYPFNGRTIALLKNSDFHFLAGDHPSMNSGQASAASAPSPTASVRW